MFRKSAAILGVAALAGAGTLDLLPQAQAKSPGQPAGIQLAACSPRNPCAAKPANPCAATPAGNPCAAQNPCAPKNPCAAQNPCAARK